MEKKYGFFMEVFFDMPLVNAKWIVKLGTIESNLLLRVNRLMNWILKKRKLEKYSLLDKIKDNKAQSKYISDFEHTVTDLAADSGYDCLFCGHIHEPKKEQRETSQGTILYLNSEDWVENRTALEYSYKR
jgi:UDP-2,3-diacylglucosamine pyrophosphatase LpxH